jgi:hypothetical protein
LKGLRQKGEKAPRGPTRGTNPIMYKSQYGIFQDESKEITVHSVKPVQR